MIPLYPDIKTRRPLMVAQFDVLEFLPLVSGRWLLVCQREKDSTLPRFVPIFSLVFVFGFGLSIRRPRSCYRNRRGRSSAQLLPPYAGLDQFQRALFCLYRLEMGLLHTQNHPYLIRGANDMQVWTRALSL